MINNNIINNKDGFTVFETIISLFLFISIIFLAIGITIIASQNISQNTKKIKAIIKAQQIHEWLTSWKNIAWNDVRLAANVQNTKYCLPQVLPKYDLALLAKYEKQQNEECEFDGKDHFSRTVFLNLGENNVINSNIIISWKTRQKITSESIKSQFTFHE